MKCHYIYTEDGDKVLIPYCWPVVLSGGRTGDGGGRDSDDS